MWHIKVYQFNQDLLGIEPRSLGPMPDKEVDHLIDALKEEADEFGIAFDNGDFIGQVDAIIDLIYFAMGGLYKMGLTTQTADEVFDHIHQKNMEKRMGVVARRARDGVKDAVKPTEWVGPEVGIGMILDKQA